MEYYRYPDNFEVKQLMEQASDHLQAMLPDLSPGVTYYLRAYATNDAGTSYGD